MCRPDTIADIRRRSTMGSASDVNRSPAIGLARSPGRSADWPHYAPSMTRADAVSRGSVPVSTRTRLGSRVAPRHGAHSPARRRAGRIWHRSHAGSSSPGGLLLDPSRRGRPCTLGATTAPDPTEVTISREVFGDSGRSVPDPCAVYRYRSGFKKAVQDARSIWINPARAYDF